MPLIAFAGGAFVIVASLLDWDWFFDNWRAALFVKMFGRNGARVFYILLGGLLIFLGYVFRAYNHLPASGT